MLILEPFDVVWRSKSCKSSGMEAQTVKGVIHKLRGKVQTREFGETIWDCKTQVKLRA